MSTSHLSLIAVYIESSISLSECHALYMCVCVVNIFPMFLSMLIFFFFFCSPHHDRRSSHIPHGLRIHLFPPLLRWLRVLLRHGALSDWLELHARNHGNSLVRLLSLPVTIYRHARSGYFYIVCVTSGDGFTCKLRRWRHGHITCRQRWMTSGPRLEAVERIFIKDYQMIFVDDPH